ncbi:putative xyloglucan endotransglucosylase/hydrolase protein 1 [Cicer arietinum]|uniref:Xyloglucan endotransglucosylase/hydrolase protein 1 n=1 Tax=Cicer arietinum TaxID=3827 RepID=A0A1S2XV59_CICAR|nr:putative xyloglucan endotransglucosylase/hydrolase protein 1 [Cicer arietinum]
MDFSRLFFPLLVFFLLALLYVNGAYEDNVPFEQNYAMLWGQENIKVLDQSREVQLTLDQHSGSGFESWHKYGSGWFNMTIKLPKKDTTSVITTFYLQSDDGPTRDEIDFEFLGGNMEHPYIMHTNIFTNDQGGREQGIHLWFDPTADFHDYTLLWNQKQLVFFVDNIPIRVFKNTTQKGGKFPTQAMKILATIWSGTWASHGVPANWNDAPFEANYIGFRVNACQVPSNQQCDSSMFWWNAHKFWDLNSRQKQALNNVRTQFLLYDYCTKSFHNPECQN